MHTGISSLLQDIKIEIKKTDTATWMIKKKVKRKEKGKTKVIPALSHAHLGYLSFFFSDAFIACVPWYQSKKKK
jgi:hypothetical protein